MRDGMSTVIRRDIESLGRGLLERAMEVEGRKGCSPFLCTEPVALEPPYQVFNRERVLGLAPGTTSPGEQVVLEPDTEPMITVELYPAPEDLLTIGWMETLSRSLSVLPGRKAYEVVGNCESAHLRFAIHREELPGFRVAIQGHFPSVRIRIVESPFPEAPPTAVNELVPVPPYSRTLTLLGAEGASPLGLIVQALSMLGPEETGAYQVLFSAVHPDHDWHHNIENLIEAEFRALQFAQMGGLSSDHRYDERLPPLLEMTAREKVRIHVAFHCTIIRYTLWSPDPGKVAPFLQAMRVGTGMVRFGNRPFRVIDHETLVASLGEAAVDRMVRERLTHRPGLPVTSREIATLVHIPNDRTLTMFPPIEQRRGFEWVPFDVDPRESGTVRIGMNHYAGEVIPVEIPLPVRMRHTYILGKTGYGKSNLMILDALQDIEADMGLCVLDPHGDAVLEILARLPERRLGDVVYISFTEPGLVPPWNPFRATIPSAKLADDMTSAILGVANTQGARMEHNFRNLFYVLHRMDWTLEDFAELISRSGQGEMLRQQALEHVTNPQTRRFLRDELPRFSAGELASVRNKLSRLLLDEQLGPTFRQKENMIHPREWMDGGRIVLINLASSVMGSEHANFAGGLILSLIHRSALARTEVKPGDRRPFMIYVDEFQNLQTGSISEMLSEGRKYGIGLVLAHQERGQLRPELAHALGNCATRIVFSPAPDDWPSVVRAFGNIFRPEDLRTLGIGDCIVGCGHRIATVRVPLCDAPRLRDPRQFAREYARKHYARVDEIDAENTDVGRRSRIFDLFAPAEGGE